MSIKLDKKSLGVWNCSRPACGYLLPYKYDDGQIHGRTVVKFDGLRGRHRAVGRALWTNSFMAWL